MQRGGMLLWRFSGFAQGLHETVNLSGKVAAGIASGRFQSSFLGFERRAPVLMLSPVLKVSRVTSREITLMQQRGAGSSPRDPLARWACAAPLAALVAAPVLLGG